MTELSVVLDSAQSVLLAIVGFFLVRLVREQDGHRSRLENHAQRLTRLDGNVE